MQLALVSGLAINVSKSKIFATGVTDYELTTLKNITRFSEGIFPVRYLGIPLMHGNLKAAHFATLMDKVTGFITAWSASTLSYAGRLELIKAVVQGVESFWLQALPIPSSIHH